MKAYEDREDEVIDLGVASIETKGVARIDLDPGGGELKFIPCIAQD